LLGDKSFARTFEITDREAYMAEGIDCYKTFIRGLLDVSDNLIKGKVIPPNSVLRYDEERGEVVGLTLVGLRERLLKNLPPHT